MGKLWRACSKRFIRIVTRLLDVESSNNSDELTRLGSKYDEESNTINFIALLELIDQFRQKREFK